MVYRNLGEKGGEGGEGVTVGWRGDLDAIFFMEQLLVTSSAAVGYDSRYLLLGYTSIDLIHFNLKDGLLFETC